MFQQAVDRWEQVITAGLPGFTISGNTNVCNGVSAYNGPVHSVRIDIVVKAIDRVGGTLGSSGPCLIRASTSLPAYGVIILDSADVDMLQAQGLLLATVTHEMGHVLGYGTLWDDFKLTTGTGNGASCGSDSQYVGALWCVSGTPSAGAETSRSRPPAVWGPVIAAGEGRCLATS